MVIFHIEHNLGIISVFGFSAWVNASDEVVAAIDQIEEDFITHQFSDVNLGVDRFSDDARGSVLRGVDIFRADTEDDILAESFLIFVRDADLEAAQVGNISTFFFN
jgi:hypothetical protein